MDRLPENVNADAAYGNEENWSFLQKYGIKNFLKYGLYRKEKSMKWKAEKLRFDDFVYDKEKDEFICKNNEKLSLVDRLSYHQSMTGGKTNLEKMRGGRASDSERACPQSEIGGSPEHFDKFEEVTRTGYVRTINKYQAPEGVCINCPFRAKCTKSRARSLDVSWRG